MVLKGLKTMFNIKNGIILLLLGASVLGTSLNVNGATVTESWLRQAGISCGGGLSVALQGEIDAAVLSRLKLGSATTEGTYQKSTTETLLKQFQQEEKRETYISYINCVMTLMDMASNTSQLPSREVELTSPISVASLETIKRGQRFVMTPGDTVAIRDHSLMFSLNKITGEMQKPNMRIYFNWSNSETGLAQANKNRMQSQIIKFEEKCSVVAYKIDVKNNQTSFISNC